MENTNTHDFRCPYCFKNYKSKFWYITHLRLKHGGNKWIAWIIGIALTLCTITFSYLGLKPEIKLDTWKIKNMEYILNSKNFGGSTAKDVECIFDLAYGISTTSQFKEVPKNKSIRCVQPLFLFRENPKIYEAVYKNILPQVFKGEKSLVFDFTLKYKWFIFPYSHKYICVYSVIKDDFQNTTSFTCHQKNWSE